MRRKDPQSPDERIARLAARQHGHATYSQLLAAGLSRTQIDRRVQDGRLIRMYAKVYAVGYVPITPIARAHAAVLACGPGAVLSHVSAAALWGWHDTWPRVPEVSTTKDRRLKGIRVHHVTRLDRPDRTRQLGVPVTSPARTHLDLAPRLPEDRLTRMFNDARLEHHLRPDALVDVVYRLPSASGASRIIRLLARMAEGGPTKSQLEDAFRAFVRRFGLPEPQVNVKVAGLEVDICYPEQRVIIEVDSWLHHGDRAAFEEDRLRDSITTAAGFRTVRVTAERLNQAEADRIRAILNG